MIPRSRRTDPRLVLGSALALLLPLGADVGAWAQVVAQTPSTAPSGAAPASQAPTGQAPTNQAPTSQVPAGQPPSPTAAASDPTQNDADALKLRDQELDAVRAQGRVSADAQEKLRHEIDAIGDDRRALNQQLIDSAARVREVEGNVEAAHARLKPLDDQEKSIRKSLGERHTAIVEILAALQRVGRQPPPALLVRPEDALQAVRTAITLGAVVPDMRAQADALAGDLGDLLEVRKRIVAENEKLSHDLDALGREQLRMNLLVDERQKKQSQTEEALDAERTRATDLARQADNLKDLIAKLESNLDSAARQSHTEARSIEQDATRPDLSALKDPGRLAPAVAFVSTRGRLHLPVNGVKVRDFGGSDGAGGTLRGQSIAARAGAQITSPCDGWVVYAGAFRSYGQLLILNAGGGYHVLLAGMERISVDLGQFVLTGEPVAVMGSGAQVSAAAATRTKQPVLYVEFRKDGAPIDPSPWWATNEGEKVRG
jgi:septal ring factor EnvC (AmiA/AmiB activator)